MTAYYNEIDNYAAEWLRNLIAAGHIAPGVVDTRSIEDVHPDDLRGFAQCHFFAGIGVWSLALRRAGWPDDRPVWTGSCPCQPFSAAGQGVGFADERHLWPAFHHLISERRPPVVLGEQVASKDADPWIDLVQDDMEGMDYAFGTIAFPSAGIGAPHGRDRIYWVGDATGGGRSQGRLHTSGNSHARGQGEKPEFGNAGTVCALADDESGGWREERAHAGWCAEGDRAKGISTGSIAGSGLVNGYWNSADWILCCDPGGARWRPIESGTFPLAHGDRTRVGRLRAYGNAINAEAARVFIEAVMECQP